MPRAAAMLTRPAVRQVASACRTYSTGVGPEGLLPPLLAAGAEEVADGALAVGAGDPAVLGAELELGEWALGLHRVERGEQGRGVDAVAGDDGGGLGHGLSSAERLSDHPRRVSFDRGER
jgi:hypothetical protein